jgi:acyl dehydratase
MLLAHGMLGIGPVAGPPDESETTMPINPDAVGARSELVHRAWTSKDSLLYALGVGAGTDDTLDELQFTTENTRGVEQRVLPTMALVLGGRTGGIFKALGPYDSAMVVHAEQRFEQHREIPAEGELESVTELIGVYDKDKYAQIVSETKAVLAGTGEPLFTNVGSVFIRGEGGWGGDRGPASSTGSIPEGAPDLELPFQTSANQALIYRLSGDRNPLHADPTFAARAGFERPILHGLCTYGFAGRLLLHALCGSDPARVRSMNGRFATPVVPGDALTVRVWATGDGESTFQAVHEDGRVAIDRGTITFAS